MTSKTLSKSALMFGALALSGLMAASAPVLAQKAANPCAPKTAANPCAAKANPCAPKAANPCAAKTAANPCAAKNPCAQKK